MQKHIVEGERCTNVCGSYDIAVVGGGIAGISAALAASRLGQKVLLIERMFGLGGLATLGLVTIYLPLCDGCGRQVSYGIAEELLKLSIKYGHETDYPDTWLREKQKVTDHGNQRYQVRYNASVFSILMEHLLKAEGVDILYGTMVAGVHKKGDEIEALIIENKDGRRAIGTGAVVDASGDADICKMAEVETKLYANANALAAWFYETIDGKTRLHMLGAADVLAEDCDNDIPERLVAKRISGVDAREISESVIESHARSLQAFLRNPEVSEEHSLTSVAAIPQLRMTRRLCGEYTQDDVEMHKEFEDSVGMFGDWRKRGPVYEVPFRSLYSRKVKNLAVAGRCISVTDRMWDITRVIPVCAVTGQAAGTALALYRDLNNADIQVIQQTLKENGVRLHEKDL